MAETGSSELILTTVGSEELGLQPAQQVADIDAAVVELPREALALRVTAVLSGLDADRRAGGRTVSISLAKALGPACPLSRALEKQNAVFLEPLQQLVLLRRLLTVGSAGRHDVSSDEGLAAYFHASRFASDLLTVKADVPEGTPIDGALALKAAAAFMQRASLLNPPHLTNWIARLRLMLNELPKVDPRAQDWADRLKARIEVAFGLNFDEVNRFAAILSLWSSRFTKLEDVFSPNAGVALNIDAWLSRTKLDKERLVKFFERTARRSDDVLPHDKLGGPTSILPFRDRPFIQFANGGVAPIHPSLVIDKLTYDLFWWSGTPDKKQDQPWQQDWGYLIEAYVVQVLGWIADQTGCGFRADIRWERGQVDAAMWFKGHVALFEISASMLTDAAANGGDSDSLRDGLTRILVRSKKSNGEPKDEALAQVARDAKALLAGELTASIPIDGITRVYPVVIAIDRRVRTPGLRFWFDEAFEPEVAGCADRDRIGALAVWTLEDLEAVEELVRVGDASLKGTPRGLLRLLRTWEMTRERLPRSGKRAAGWSHLVGHQIPVPPVNQRLKEESDRWWSEVRNLFRDTPGLLADSPPPDSLSD